ncbi:unnamed protein product [Staurois parvus]|uniref:Uncharacterized protein n=1 Tax=Staurois parvus TaxID=386267 RepID=A0ABN9BEK0_9NEOB|nr:unnamed protein product [Staurois parvus]
MALTLVISGKNVPYICGQWQECSLHQWTVQRMLFTLVVRGKNVLILVVSERNATYIGCQWEKRC